jgi:preprotein translocase subunit SecE
MGKVKDEISASKPAKPSKGGQSGDTKRRFMQFFANLLDTQLYKPRQGWYARLYTALGLGVILVLGLWRLHETLMTASLGTRYGVPALVGAVLAWVVFRLVQYPPFVEFLIATEAEMNKVSWTSRDDLYRATSVVLATVVLMSVFLFGVDWLWSNLLQLIGVLKFGGGGGFGSTA